MWKEETGNVTVLPGERLGDEKKIRAILTEWGMDQAAIKRMLTEHRAQQASVRQVSEEATVGPALKSRGSHARVMSSNSYSREESFAP
jgi:hypothetical protein